MTDFPTDEDLRATPRKLRDHKGLSGLARLVCLSERTLYRHAGDPDQWPDFDSGTRGQVTAALLELGLVGSYGPAELVAAVKLLRAKSAAGAVGKAKKAKGAKGKTIEVDG